MGAYLPRRLFAAICTVLLSLTLSAKAAEDSSVVDRLQSPITCVKQKSPIDCDLLTDCVWCEKPGSKFGTGCYPISAAKLLPKSWGVECDKDLNPPSAAASSLQQQVVDANLQGTCDNKPEASCVAPDCVWCTSAAVGGGCYTPDEAKLLPKAIFKCKAAPTAQ